VTTFLLIRHATCDPVGKRLAGRAPGVSLNAEGREQATRLATWLAAVRVDAVYASPLERAQETAAYLAEPRGLPVHGDAAFTDIDFGEWTGRAIDTLADDAHWRRFNEFRSVTRPPGGELMLEAQARAVAGLDALALRHAGHTVVVVSHADVLRTVVGHFAGAPLDLFLRLEISPASVTTLVLHDWGAQLRAVNASPTPVV
jgi:probable phosphoglycerate mutase